MGRRLVRAAVVASMLAAALAGCSPDGDSAFPTATVGTEPPRTTTTNPYAVPTIIDAAYVNRVLEGLDAVKGDIVRTIVREKTIPYEIAVRLQSLYIDKDAWQLVIDGFQKDLQAGLTGYPETRPETPGNKRTTVTKILSATESCVFAEVERDYSPFGSTARQTKGTLWVGVRPLDRARYSVEQNPTNWGYVLEGFTPDRTQPQDPCS